MTTRPSGVTSPPAMRGTTEYVPSFCRLAITWSLVSCRVAFSPSRTWPRPSEARIEATTGLQTSQPRPRPCWAITSLKVRSSLTRITSYSSARERSKCSQRAVLTSMPAASSSAVTSCLTSGTQLPQLVPARVQPLTAPTSVQPPSVTAQRIVLALTPLQEQTTASSGSAPRSAVARSAGSSQDAGFSPSELPTMGRSAAYAEASPTSTPPRSSWASSDRTSFWYTPRTGSAWTTSSEPSPVPKASPKLATSTPSSFSLVDMSGSSNVAAPASSRSATTSAIVYPGATRPRVLPPTQATSPTA